MNFSSVTSESPAISIALSPTKWTNCRRRRVSQFGLSQNSVRVTRSRPSTVDLLSWIKVQFLLSKCHVAQFHLQSLPAVSTLGLFVGLFVVMGLPFFSAFHTRCSPFGSLYSQSHLAFEQKKKARTTETGIYQQSSTLRWCSVILALRWENPYKIDNISSGTPGRTNTADKPFKPNNVCNAISYRSQVYRLALKMRNAQRINYTVKCTTIYCVCQHIIHYIL